MSARKSSRTPQPTNFFKPPEKAEENLRAKPHGKAQAGEGVNVANEMAGSSACDVLPSQKPLRKRARRISDPEGDKRFKPSVEFFSQPDHKTVVFAEQTHSAAVLVGGIPPQLSQGKGEEQFFLEKILQGPRKKDARFLIKWQNYSSKHNSWEPAENLHADVVKRYMAQKSKSKAKANCEHKPKVVPASTPYLDSNNVLTMEETLGDLFDTSADSLEDICGSPSFCSPGLAITTGPSSCNSPPHNSPGALPPLESPGLNLSLGYLLPDLPEGSNLGSMFE